MPKKFVGCARCSDLGGYYTAHLEDGEEIVKKCRCLKIYEKETSLTQAVDKAGLPKIVDGYTISDYIGKDTNDNLPKIKKYIDEFKDRYQGKSLYIYGPYGTQKTTVVCWMAKRAIGIGISVTYDTMNNLVSKLVDKADFQKKDSVDISQYENVDLLILDEAFDKNKMLWYASNYQMPFLDSFLRNRLEVENKSIVFVSNTPPEEISSKFDRGLQDLIIRNTSGGWLHFEDHYSIKDNFDPNDMWR